MRFIFLSFVFFCSSQSVAGEDSWLLIAPDPEQQSLKAVLIERSGSAAKVLKQSIALPFKPSGITDLRDGTRLIVTGRKDSRAEGGYAAAELEVESEQLKLLGIAALSYPAGYTSVDRKETCFLTADYKTGDLAVYRLNESGRLGEICSHIRTPEIYAHCILTTPDNQYAYVPCVKENNALFQYAFLESEGRLKPLVPYNAKPPAMFGPRHVAYHPRLPMAYFSNEQQLGVSVFEIDSHGQLRDIQHATSMPRRAPYQSGKRGLHGSDLVVSADGNRLYLAVRDFVGTEDSVFSYEIEEDGRLKQIGRTRVGDIPWKLSLSPDGNVLFVSESAQRTLAVFRTDKGEPLVYANRLDWDLSARDMVLVSVR